MGFPHRYFTAIAFCLALTVMENSGELVLRHSPMDDGETLKLTCISEDDDDAALIWNYNPNLDEVRDHQNSFTDFHPKKPPSKNLNDCAMRNSTLGLADWENLEEWHVVNSTNKPMGPVLDYRWEDFKEFASEQTTGHREYQYVVKIEETSSTAVFSVRGSQDVYIFLCESRDPTERICFWIIIGGWKNTRSAIRSCVGGAPKPGKFTEGGNCVDVANVTHGAEGILDAYAWRTFRLEWNSERRTIRIFNETEVEPFLEGKVAQWHPVSHLSFRSELLARVRFHFYKYFLAKNKNAVISTTEFVLDDEKFCAKVPVALCPECELNVTLVDSENGDIPIATISGQGNSVRDELLTWRSVRLNATLPNLNSRPVKLRMMTRLMENGVGGLWAIDKFRTCESVVGPRESTITIHREMLDFATPFWPTVKCQKLSYTANTVVDLIAGTPVFPGTSTEAKPHTEDGLVLNRKARSRAADLTMTASPHATLELYEADVEDNSISIRLRPVQPGDNDIDEYTVLVLDGITELVKKTFKVVDGLECTLWEDSVCFEKYRLLEKIKLKDARTPAHVYIIKVRGIKAGEIKKKWETEFKPTFYQIPSSEPEHLTWKNHGHGMVTLTWRHPLFLSTKIHQFHISIRPKKTRLLQYVSYPPDRSIDMPITKEEREYTKLLWLLTATEYEIAVGAENKQYSKEANLTFRVPSDVRFASGASLKVKNNGTFIELEIPAVVNATTGTFLQIVMKGMVTCAGTNTEKKWIALKDKVVHDELPISKSFDANKTVPNCILNHGKTYEIKVEIVDEWSINATSTSLPARFITFPAIDSSGQIIPEDKGPILIWLIIFPIIAIFLLLFVIWYRKFRRPTIQWREPSYLDLTLPPLTTTLRRSSTVICTANSSPSQPGIAENRLSSHLYTLPKEPDSRSVNTEYFEEYTKQGSTSGLLRSQFMLLRKGLTKPCEYGRLPENMLKNRYRNLVAYDDTRVILEKIPGEPYSDYINASYIKGYKKDKAYIATQGPKPNTVNDFWRMIWQEKVRVICMLTNLIGGNKENCEKYWPDVGTRVNYGDFHVSNTDQRVFADYTFRTFELSNHLDKRTVRHLHYTGWPILGVPTYPQSLVAYLKKLEQTPAGNGPVVVHCHTGAGRTGTIILCDTCLRQAAAEKVIDVTAVITRMRDSRANMVGTLQQYVLAHIIIAESMVSMPTQIPCTKSLASGIKKMRMRLPSDMRRLEDTMWQGRVLQSLAVPRPPTVEDAMSDECPEHDPEIPQVIYDDVSASKSNWVNAVCVDGVRTKNQYLASCLPAPFTLADFWIFVAERKIKLIVILQCSDPSSPTCRDIMPDESIVLRVPDVQVENKARLDDDHFTTEELLLTDVSEENTTARSVTVLTCKGWGRGERGKPPKPVTLVSLWRASERITRNEGQTLVLCHNGVSGCGLYLALSFVLERMAVERECDVISAVRTVRQSNPEFVQSLEQCEYLYDAAKTYVDYFQCYANFA